jgi:hypothetical protein
MMMNEKVMSRSGKRMMHGNNRIEREIENIRKYEIMLNTGGMYGGSIGSPMAQSSPLIAQFNQQPQIDYTGNFLK